MKCEKIHWVQVRVGELGKIVTGKTPKTSILENYGGKIPFLTPSDNMLTKYVTATKKSLTDKGVTEVKNCLLPENSVCVSCIGSELGKVVITTEPTVTNQQINSIIVDQEKFDVSFIYYAMLILGKQLNYLSKTSTAVPIVNKTAFSSYSIFCPELWQQKEIAAILSSLDDKIELNNKINENLLAQAQTLFAQRFIVDDIEGVEKPLYDFADYINGAAFKPSECGNQGLPIIKIAELKNGITNSTKYFNGFKGEKYIIQDKDILFSWSGNPDTSIDIFIWTYGKAILNQHTFNVKSKTDHRWFVFLMLKYFKHEFSRIASNKQTTGLGHVTANDLKQLTFISNESAIEGFEREVSPFMETIYSNMMENQSLAQLRDNLLPKLISGELLPEEGIK